MRKPKRSRVKSKHSKKLFTKTAKRVHPRNRRGPSRGGISI